MLPERVRLVARVDGIRAIRLVIATWIRIHHVFGIRNSYSIEIEFVFVGLRVSEYGLMLRGEVFVRRSAASITPFNLISLLFPAEDFIKDKAQIAVYTIITMNVNATAW